MNSTSSCGRFPLTKDTKYFYVFDIFFLRDNFSSCCCDWKYFGNTNDMGKVIASEFASFWISFTVTRQQETIENRNRIKI